MNFTQIKDTVLGYADRYDAEVAARFSLFVPVVEGRINTTLTTRFSLKDLIIPIVSTNNTFTYPPDVLFLKQVKLVNASGEYIFQYVNEEYFGLSLDAGKSKPYYTVTNNALRLACNFLNDGTEYLHLRYEQQVPPLEAAVTNWVSMSAPQLYIFGLLVELYAFIKDAEAAAAWDVRFTKELSILEDADSKVKWSGVTPLQMRVG